MTCPHCGTDTPAGAARCSVCGAPRTPAAVSGVTPNLDVAAAIVGGRVYEATGTHSVAMGTHQLDIDGTRLIVPASIQPHPDAHRTTTSGPRQFTMLTPGETLGGRYHIIRLLGVGGMGAVYHAWDAELGVAVALKVIRGDITGDTDQAAAIERQFKRELLMARQVTHKHVVRIHDLGDVDGLKYISMPYVQGADLATVLQQSGTLAIPRALAYVKQIVDGLVAAHEAGVIHRDLKPANIMIDEDDQALIMDFGIARSPSNTGSGMSKVVGTLAYMAPEQAQALPTDQRADVYALGMMFREMLVGRTRSGDDQQAVADLMQRIKEAPPRVRTIDPLVPEPLDALIARCVEPDRANRFQTSAELAAALAALDTDGRLKPAAKAVLSPWRMTAAAVLVVATIGAAAIAVRRVTPPVPAKPIDPVSILVADFENKTGDAVFDGALEQALTIEMESAAFINAASRPDAQRTAKALKGAAKLDAATAQLVAFRQGTKYLLAGDVSPKGGGFTLHLRAIDPATGAVVKDAAADAKTKSDVLPAVSMVASRMRSALGDKTASASKPPAETFTAGSLEAFREYTTAQELANVARRDDEAVKHYRQAIEQDPKFGRAYAGLAVSAQRLGASDEATQAFNTALSLMDRMTDREKYRTLGGYYLQVVQNYDKAVENYSALVAAYPTDSAGLGNLALAHFYVHDFPRAVDESARAVAMDPKNLLQRNNLALYGMYAGAFGDAAAAARKLIADQGPTESTYLPLVMEAVSNGDIAAAGVAYDDMAKRSARGASIASLGKADLALYGGRLEAAETELKNGLSVEAQSRSGALAALKQVAYAETLLAAGRKAQAIDAAHAALKITHDIGVTVPAARVLILAGKAGEARAIATELEGQLQKQNRAYGKILLAEIALDEKAVPRAIDLLKEALALSDLWLGRFDLGRAYIQRDASAEALSEFEICQKRRGEATALFFDERPTVRYLATLPYWIGRAEEGLKMASAKSRYDSFLTLRKDATADSLVDDARKRLTR
jgi:tetratricopeptide (TPR) repeat protein